MLGWIKRLFGKKRTHAEPSRLPTYQMSDGTKLEPIACAGDFDERDERPDPLMQMILEETLRTGGMVIANVDDDGKVRISTKDGTRTVNDPRDQ